jgi:hypothetical protein
MGQDLIPQKEENKTNKSGGTDYQNSAVSLMFTYFKPGL